MKASVEWTKLNMSFLLRQLEVFAKPKSQEAENQSPVKKWTYIINLCVVQYHEGLLYHFDFLKNVLLIFQKCSVRQLPCMIPLLSKFVKEFSKVRLLSRQLVFACMQRMANVFLLDIAERTQFREFISSTSFVVSVHAFAT